MAIIGPRPILPIEFEEYKNNKRYVCFKFNAFLKMENIKLNKTRVSEIGK